jgi:flavin reductase
MPVAVESGHDAFRLAMRRMAATVSILTTRMDEQPYGMTATAVSPVSMAPPALLVSINQSASIHEPLKRIGAFWVNLLGDDHDKHCFAFSGKLAGADRFRCGSWQEERGMPLLADAQANIFCEVDLQIPFATHTIFIARMIEARISDAVRPLIYLDGRPCSSPVYHDPT